MVLCLAFDLTLIKQELHSLCFLRHTKFYKIYNRKFSYNKVILTLIFDNLQYLTQKLYNSSKFLKN